ncbi:SOS response-associated peptidase [Brevibacterium sp. 5221]|uniref:Abasic site processing protein n=1 Tax=Brevibacterium rongguiense TaxID=2695267 RepID=A0A6N9H424_9MICO|nr:MULTISPECIES: SOS response-associated peptidase [Brevibacterium]MYM18760.1 SOS response-associated peptidase [Brevibacterium rongguiense]WAL40250.1 SOS response-associated peptidase [Brevibacterium sp. BRM-1]
MCGRLNLSLDPADLVDELDIARDGYPYRERYNVPPSAVIPIIADRPAESGEVSRRLEAARWGLVPGWAKDIGIGSRAFNARSETIADKPMFRTALGARRCIVPCAGYYEWERTEAGKQPWFMHPESGDWLFMAGVFEFRRVDAELADGTVTGEDPAVQDGWLVSASIITAPAAGHLTQVHDRMPVMLDRAGVERWLDPSLAKEEAAAVLGAAIADFDPTMVARRRVGQAVGKVGNEGPQLVAPVPAP